MIKHDQELTYTYIPGLDQWLVHPKDEDAEGSNGLLVDTKELAVHIAALQVMVQLLKQIRAHVRIPEKQLGIKIALQELLAHLEDES